MLTTEWQNVIKIPWKCCVHFPFSSSSAHQNNSFLLWCWRLINDYSFLIVFVIVLCQETTNCLYDADVLEVNIYIFLLWLYFSWHLKLCAVGTSIKVQSFHTFVSFWRMRFEYFQCCWWVSTILKYLQWIIFIPTIKSMC